MEALILQAIANITVETDYLYSLFPRPFSILERLGGVLHARSHVNYNATLLWVHGSKSENSALKCYSRCNSAFLLY